MDFLLTATNMYPPRFAICSQGHCDPHITKARPIRVAASKSIVATQRLKAAFFIATPLQLFAILDLACASLPGLLEHLVAEPGSRVRQVQLQSLRALPSELKGRDKGFRASSGSNAAEFNL